MLSLKIHENSQSREKPEALQVARVCGFVYAVVKEKVWKVRLAFRCSLKLHTDTEWSLAAERRQLSQQKSLFYVAHDGLLFSGPRIFYSLSITICTQWNVRETDLLNNNRCCLLFSFWIFNGIKTKITHEKWCIKLESCLHVFHVILRFVSTVTKLNCERNEC